MNGANFGKSAMLDNCENETFMWFWNSVSVWKWLTLTINFPPHQIPFIYPTSSSCFRARKVSFSSTYPRKWVYPFPVRTCYWKIILVYFRRIGGSLFLLFLLQYRIGWAEFYAPILRAKRAFFISKLAVEGLSFGKSQLLNGAIFGKS